MRIKRKEHAVSKLPQTRVLLRTTVIAGLSLALVYIVPAAHADDLNTTKSNTQSQIQANTNQTNQDQATLSKASSALQQTEQNLVQAKADLIAKQQATQEAQADDARLADAATQAQQTLTARQADLLAAQQAVTAGQAKVQSERDTIGLIAQEAAQQNTTLMSLSMMLTNLDISHMSDQIQWTGQAFDSSQNAMNDLLQAQTQLQQAQDQSQQAEDAAASAQAAAQQASQAAAAHLTVTQQAEATAQQAQQTVATQVTANQKAQANAQAAVNADKTKQTQLQQQLAQIEQQIAEAAAADSHTVDVPALPSNVSVAAAQAIAKSLMPDYGFGTSQWGCLVNLWNYESGWRVNARNPSSGAYGIPQSLPASKMASIGSDWLTNPSTQIKWGLGYIKGRYVNPCGAWSHEMAHNWY